MVGLPGLGGVREPLGSALVIMPMYQKCKDEVKISQHGNYYRRLIM